MLTQSDVERIAHLARLEIDQGESKVFSDSLSRILALIEEMNAVDTSGIEPMAHPQDVGLRLREDEVTETNRRAELQGIAPATEDGLYLVPRVVG
ncbi:MAG: Asp-tRNA(Asn)/Glu-tRNA(Gln) amidotransferase subunit GatC [Gammaproteobacteria bacterium]|nr:Asp-tRNA(Asn)/Glu-tRNA(Gln) amidotransferase subunit GatC [Gammaproteobacteria bacterium]